MTSPVVQLRVPDETLTRIDAARGESTRTAWLLSAIDHRLGHSPAAANPLPPGTLAGGIPCPGACCSHPGCWEREGCRRYGNPADHGGLILCPAHAAAITGRTWQRPHSPLPARPAPARAR